MKQEVEKGEERGRRMSSISNSKSNILSSDHNKDGGGSNVFSGIADNKSKELMQLALGSPCSIGWPSAASRMLTTIVTTIAVAPLQTMTTTAANLVHTQHHGSTPRVQ